MKHEHHPKPTPLLWGFLFWVPLKLIGWVLLSWGITLLVASSLLAWCGSAISLHYLQQLINVTLIDLSGSHAGTLFVMQPAQWTLHFAQNLLQWLLIKTHVQSALRELPPLPVPHTFYFQHIIKTLRQLLTAWGNVLWLTTLLAALRLGIFILFLPTFFLLGTIALIDGLVLRDLRKLHGGRESALLYHRAKSYIFPAIYWSGFCYLILPIAVCPAYVLLPFALLFAFAIRLTASSFKKYL